jgi:hypothetical protein
MNAPKRTNGKPLKPSGEAAQYAALAEAFAGTGFGEFCAWRAAAAIMHPDAAIDLADAIAAWRVPS